MQLDAMPGFYCAMPISEIQTRLTANVDEAADALRQGQLVAFPTETVYGLGADAKNPEAVRHIFIAKGRPVNHPLIVHLADAMELSKWVAGDFPRIAEALKLAEAFWPGPLTLILPRAKDVPLEVTGGQETVGLRVPNHPVALQLLRTFGGGVAAPSANRFGRISPTRAAHVLKELTGRVNVVIDGGDCDIGVESTILSLVGEQPMILRPGHIHREQIEAILGQPVVEAGESDAGNAGSIRASGTLPGHYAPTIPLEVVSREQLIRQSNKTTAVLARFSKPNDSIAARWVVAPQSAEAYARELYANMRSLDENGISRMLVEAVPGEPAWLAVADRLRRAAFRES